MVWRVISVLGMGSDLAGSVVVAQSTWLALNHNFVRYVMSRASAFPSFWSESPSVPQYPASGKRQGWFLLDTGTNVSVVDFHAYDFPGT